MGRKIQDLVGKTFNMLTVLKMSDTYNKSVKWDCLCVCGTICTVIGDSLKNGSTKSCGCLRKSQLKTHGESGSSLYRRWGLMIDRCENPKSDSYQYYGAKGVKVCAEWRNHFESFRKWADNTGFQPELELDRINVDGDYEPDNCRWVDLYTQAYNKTTYSSNTSGVVGVTWVDRDKKWQSRINVGGVRLSLGYFEKFEDAVEARQSAEIKYYGGLKNEQSNRSSSNTSN